MKLKLALFALLLTLCTSAFADNCTGGGQLGCCACSYSYCIHDFYGVQPFPVCGCYTAGGTCFSSGHCTSISGWAYCGAGPQKQGSDADDVVYFSDTKNIAKAGCSEVKDTLLPVTSDLLTVYPWIGSSVLVDLVTREAVVPETGKFLKLAQEQVKAKGLNDVFSLQTGSPDQGLVGALFTYHGKGVYWMEVYQEASEDGKTKHTSIGGMIKDGILPVETIKFSANHYTHTTPNGTAEGTF